MIGGKQAQQKTTNHVVQNVVRSLTFESSVQKV